MDADDGLVPCPAQRRCDGLHQLPVVLVAEHFRRLAQPHETHLVHLRPRHELALQRLHQPVADHLRPVSGVPVGDLAHEPPELATQPRLLLHLAQGAGLVRLAGIAFALRQRPVVVRGAVHDHHLPAAVRRRPHDDPAGGVDEGRGLHAPDTIGRAPDASSVVPVGDPVGREEVEVEWQLDALDLRPVERWLAQRAPGINLGTPAAADEGEPSIVASPRPAARLLDVYFDTVDWRVGRSGFVLRCRRKGRGREATLKELSAANEGLRKRLEATEPLDPEGDGRLDLDPDGPVGRRVRSLAGARQLVPVLEVRTRRRPFDLTMDGRHVGEVALDETAITVGGDATRLNLRRVEVEVGAAYVDALSPLVEQLRRDCGLHPAMLSKFEAGLMAAGLSIPNHAPPAEAPITADTTALDLALAVLRRDAAAMLQHEAETRLGDDPEELHQMRVATRRQRAALSLFADLLPARAAAVSEELRWLADLLGTVRDLDVQMDKLVEWTAGLPPEHQPALEQLASLLSRHRAAGRQELLAALESRRYERLVVALRALVDRPGRPTMLARQPAVVVVPDLIAGRHRKAVKAAKRAEKSRLPGDFHQLRIRCKRLRYAVEFAAPLYGPESKRLSKRIAGLQDELGQLQDAEAAAQFLKELAVGSGAVGGARSGRRSGRARSGRRSGRARSATTPLPRRRSSPWGWSPSAAKRMRPGGCRLLAARSRY